MIRPAAFGYNEQTAADNSFQHQLPGLSFQQVQKKVLKEFDEMVDLLRKHDIEVMVFDDTIAPAKTDAVFPNNWFNTMPDGSVSVFPMYASSRRLEKRDDILKQLTHAFEVTRFTDWSELEAEGFFLTSSLGHPKLEAKKFSKVSLLISEIEVFDDDLFSFLCCNPDTVNGFSYFNGLLRA